MEDCDGLKTLDLLVLRRPLRKEFLETFFDVGIGGRTGSGYAETLKEGFVGEGTLE